MITSLALRARIPVLVAMVALMAAGVYSLTNLRVQLFPDVDFPLISVSTLYPGADVDTVLADVTLPLEQALAQVPDSVTISSITSPSFSLVIRQFDFGTDMEEAEQHHNDTIDRVEQLEHQIALYPIRIEETRQSMAADAARRERAQINVALAQVRAPFDARVTKLDLEVGHFAPAAVSVLELADDTALEIPVKLDATDVRHWLRFDHVTTPSNTAWFAALTQVPCEIRWVEDTDGQTWEGTLHRVEQFDPETRTLTVAVFISSQNACQVDGQGLPLVAGMFCEVTIPGRTLRDVYPFRDQPSRSTKPSTSRRTAG